MFGGWLCYALVLSLTDPRVVAMDLGEQIEGCARACTMALGLQAHAHDTVEDEGQEADHGVRADTLGQPMMHRRDLDVGFQDAEATLDVCKALVARDGVGGREVRGVGDQRQLPVEELGLGYGVVIDRPAEPIRIQIDLEEPGEFGFRDGACEAAVGPAVRGAAALGGLAGILRVELADHLLGHGFQLGDAGAPPVALLSGAHRVIGHDEPMAGEAALDHAALVEVERPEGLDQLFVAACRDGEDELQRAPALFGQRCQCIDVVEAQQATVSYQDHALDGEALQDSGQHGQQGLGLGHVARMHSMHQRQALGGLHEAKDELARDATGFLVHTVGADVVVNLAFAMDAHGGQVVEDHGQLLIDQGADLLGQFDLHAIDVVHKGVHGAQEVMMLDLGGHLGHGHGVQPAQAAQFTRGVAYAVEDHGPHKGLDMDLSSAGA